MSDKMNADKCIAQALVKIQNSIEQKSRVKYETMAAALQLSREELSEIIGPNTATLSRIFTKSNAYINPLSKEGELARLLLRLYCSLDVLFGGNQNQCQLWLRSHNKHLSGIPIDLIKSIEGLVFVIEYLDSMRAMN